MKKRREAWYRNPFRLGGAGLVAVLAGYAALASGAAEREISALYVLGRLTFLVGLIAMLAAGTLWFLDAHRPEPVEDEEAEDEE